MSNKVVTQKKKLLREIYFYGISLIYIKNVRLSIFI